MWNGSGVGELLENGGGGPDFGELAAEVRQGEAVDILRLRLSAAKPAEVGAAVEGRCRVCDERAAEAEIGGHARRRRHAVRRRQPGDDECVDAGFAEARSEEHTSELQSLMPISYA